MKHEYFTIDSIIGMTNNRFNNGENPWEITAHVSVDAKHWNKFNKKSNLGALYGIDICNAVHSINDLVPAHGPLVGGGDKRASKGLKRLTLTFFLGDLDKARALGFKLTAGKYASYGDRVVIYNKDTVKSNVIPFRKVVAS